MFWDRMIEKSPSEVYPRLRIHSTNPCVVGDTLVATPKGWKKAEEIKVGDYISTVLGYGQVENVEVYENTPVFNVEFDDGTAVVVTASHQFHAIRKEDEKFSKKYTPIMLRDLKVGDYVRTSGFECWDLESYFSLNERNEDFKKGFSKGSLLCGEIPAECFSRNSKEYNRGMLDGVFSTNGEINTSDLVPQIILKSKSKMMLKQVKQILLSFNIFSTLCSQSTKKTLCLEDDFILLIEGKNIETFIKKIGFSHSKKRKVCNDLLLKWSLTDNEWKVKIKSIRSAGVAKVYDLYEPTTDTWITNGIVSRGCGEQVLEPGGCCSLASLLLHQFVENPFTDEAKFNFDLFSTMIWRAVRHLDNIVELNLGKHALEEQEEAAKLGRRIGLGVTGLADMLAALKIRYDSDEALKFVDAIMEFKKLQEYAASIDLARERGPFPLFDAKKHFSRGFCSDLPEDLKDLAREHGLRNVAISTVAPNGTLSVIAQCSSGIEPIFALSYSRTVQMGGAKEKFKVYHQGLSRFLEGDFLEDDLNNDLSNLPDYWVVSHEINYENRIRLQGVVQKHVDASISSTINLPEGTDYRVVDLIYRNAWKAGLKGVTVYVEGSRDGILVTDDFAKQAGIPAMNSVVHCVRAEGGDKFYIIVSYKNREIDKPYQVFVMNYKRAECDAFVKIGNALIKMLREQKVSEKRIQKYIDRSSNSLAKLTRFLSLSMKTNNLERALNILDEHAFAGTLATKLHQILSDSATAKKAACPMCKSTNLRMEEGCLRCLDCQWSGCN
jgi:ribonucleoside-diphosphate reductase alpha chain